MPGVCSGMSTTQLLERMSDAWECSYHGCCLFLIRCQRRLPNDQHATWGHLIRSFPLTGPANLQVLDRPSVLLPNIEQPVEDVVVIFRVESDLVRLIENFHGLLAYGLTRPQGATVGGHCPRLVGRVDQPSLPGVGNPVCWRTVVVVMIWFSRET